MDFLKLYLLVNIACFVGLVDARPTSVDETDLVQEGPNTDAGYIMQVDTPKPDSVGNEPVKISIPLLEDKIEAEAEAEDSPEVGTSGSINVPVGETANSLGLGGIANNLNTIGGPPYSPTNYGTPYLDAYGPFGGDSVLGLGGQYGPQSAFGLQGVYDGYGPESGFGPQSGFRYNQPNGAFGQSNGGFGQSNGAFGQNFGSQASRLGLGSLGNFLSQFLVQFRSELLRSLGGLTNRSTK